MRYDAIYFDLDGTLWDVTDLLYEVFNEMVAKYNLKPISKEQVEKCMGKTSDECIEILFSDLLHEESIKYFKEALDIATQKLLIQGGKLYDGLEDTLKSLIDRGYKLGIVSNCIEGYIEAFMISSGLGKYFNDIVAAGKKEIPKGDAIKLAITRDGVRSAIYVGDTLKDQEAARDAGIEFIHARYGFGKELQAEYYINSIKELPEFMNRIDS